MLFVRLPFLHRLIGLLGLLLTVGAANPALAQPAQCFRVTDVLTGQTVTALCVGRAYYLRNCGPIGPLGFVVYDPGDGTGFQPANDTLVTYTTTGPVVIRQLINQPPANPIIQRTYQVYPTGVPRVFVEPCLRSVRVRLPDLRYTHYTYSIAFNGNPPTGATVVAGSTVSSALAPIAATVRVRVTGKTIVAGQPTGCESVVFDTSLTLPVVPPRPRIRLLDVLAPTSAQRVRLRLERLVPGTEYVVERATPTGAFASLPGSINPTTDTLSLTLTGAPTTTRHRYRLRQVRAPFCDVPLPPTDPSLLSNEAGAYPLAGATLNPIAATITLRWLDHPATGTVLQWRVRRDGRQIARLPATARTYTEAVPPGCPRTICYEVVAAVRSPGFALTDTLFAVSADSCLRTPGTPPPPPLLTASFDLNNNLVLRAKQVPAGLAASFDFSETRGSPPPTLLGTTPGPVFVVVAPDTAVVRESCFSVVVTDTCGQRSSGRAAACPTVLRGVRAPDGRTAELSWTAYRDFGPATYTIEQLDDQTNALIRSTPLRGVFAYSDTFAPRQVLRYRIRAEVGGDTARVAYSNVIDLIEPQLVRLPTAFTPNDDGLNDTFGPVGRYELREQELTIFDRWGREVFHSTTPGQNWDGRAAGAIVPPGVFVYRFRARDAAGQVFNQKGSVTVLR